MLDSGCARHVEAAHGESILILSGAEINNTFTCVREVEQDIVINSELGEDRRAKIIIRFRSPVPNIGAQDILQTADGKKWNAVRAPQDGYLTNDFELREIVDGTDT